MIRKSIFFTLIIFSFLACEDEINYQGEFEENYALFCVINADSSKQTAMVKKNFSDKGSEENNYVHNVIINLSSKNKSEQLKDTSLINNNEVTEIYYTDNFKPANGSKVEIRAEIPNGKILSSTIAVPYFTLFFFEESNLFIPDYDDPSRLFVGWSLHDGSDGLAFLTRLSINYTVNMNGVETKHILAVPVEYIIQNDNKLPVYPQATRTAFQIYRQSIIDETLNEISAGDTSKSSYTIQSANFEVFIMEQNLANYSASIESFKNSFSVKVYEPVITNIDGGLGVFGAYVKRSMKINFEPSYVRSFGYKYKKD
ncbi:MAG: DUF4249 family protein [Ignavibacteriales bacterium]|nr:DUF4249 family protein [Ignavibacteriales bacterium]